MTTHPYFEDPEIAEGLSKIKALSSAEERKTESKRLRKIAMERHPGLEARMSGSVEELFSALESKDSSDNDFLLEVDEVAKKLVDSEDEFPVIR